MAASSNKLAGKWCVVTGGGKGIGQAIAETFAAEGASIALVARSKDKLEEVTHCSWQALHNCCPGVSHDIIANVAGSQSMQKQGCPSSGDLLCRPHKLGVS